MGLSLIISILLVVSFVGITIFRTKEIPESISAIVFTMKHPWLWSVWLWASTLTLAPSLLNALPEKWQFFGFLALASLLFTGVFPLIDKEHKRWHYILSITAGVLLQLCVLFICQWWLILWIITAMYVILGTLGANDDWYDEYNGKGVFISEMVCYLTTICSILIH